MSRKKRVVIYDFDGTLFNSPTREIGEVLYLEATGDVFPFVGWWGRIESLIPPVVPDKPGKEWFISKTVDAFRKDEQDNETERILMTGRPFKNRRRVIEICDHHGLSFHNYYFRGQSGQKGSDTFEIKMNFIQDHLIHPELEILEIWEDRIDHVSGFLNLAKEWKSKYSNHLKEVIVHNVSA